MNCSFPAYNIIKNKPILKKFYHGTVLTNDIPTFLFA